ncbi:MAG: hypothetical protein JXA71_20705, partial [Chitinispirillaceae bacterium]|nr:hypothetical protein [Chitinispirillaceae bacterium]
MKTVRLVPPLLMTMIIMCGIQFPTRYERVENDRVRTLAFVYDNKTLAEAAPGDTVTLRSYFAGERVSGIQWTVSTRVITDNVLGDTFGDTESLSGYMVPGRYREYFGGGTDSAVFDFVVPPDVITVHFGGDMTVADLMPSGAAVPFPEPFSSVPVSALIESLDSIAGMIPARIFELPGYPPYQWLTAALAGAGLGLDALEPLLQMSSVNIKIFALVNGKHRVESTLTVRYNSRFHILEPAISINHNPSVNWIEIVRLKKDSAAVFYDPLRDTGKIDAVFPFNDADDTVPIDEGYRYFLVCDSAAASLDSGSSLTGGNVERENLLCRWFFRNEENVDNVPLDSLVSIQGSPYNSAALLPPV